MRLICTALWFLACLSAFNLLVAMPAAYAEEINAGPIWNDADAQRKCPGVCGARQWDGNWHTTAPGSMSVCNCGGNKNNSYKSSSSKSKTSFNVNVSAPSNRNDDWLGELLGFSSPGVWPAAPGGTSCSVGKTKHCAGCSVTCNNGRQASCEPGKDWAGPNSSCMFSAKCRCN